MLKIIVLTVVLLLLMPVSVYAAPISIEHIQNADIVSVDLDGNTFYENEPLLINGITYVQYDEYLNTASTNKHVNFEININTDYNYIVANDRYLYYGENHIYIDGQLYVPIRTVSKIFNCYIEWDKISKKVIVTSGTDFIENGDSFYDYDDLYWLSRIIYAESGVESFEGKLAVGTVVMNRVASDEFPNDIYSVIFDTDYGIQFTPTSNKSIYNTPDDESVIAAKICLDGYRTDKNILYFLDESIATSRWIIYNRSYKFTIGSHDFYT